MKKDGEGLLQLVDELRDNEEVTLNEFIEHLKKMADLGFGNHIIRDEVTGGIPYPYYYKYDDTLEI